MEITAHLSTFLLSPILLQRRSKSRISFPSSPVLNVARIRNSSFDPPASWWNLNSSLVLICVSTVRGSEPFAALHSIVKLCSALSYSMTMPYFSRIISAMSLRMACMVQFPFWVWSGGLGMRADLFVLRCGFASKPQNTCASLLAQQWQAEGHRGCLRESAH